MRFLILACLFWVTFGVTFCSAHGTLQVMNWEQATLHYLAQAFAPDYLSSWVLAFFAVVTAIAAILTLCSINKQVKSGQDAAEAALLNARALITSERPWLVVKIKFEPNQFNTPPYTVTATNKGSTPALLQEGHCSLEVHSAYGFEPPDDIRDPFIAPMDNLIVSEEGFVMRAFTDPDRMDLKPNPNATDPGTLYVYGRLLYWDTFTDRMKSDAEPYVTQWCFRYDPIRKTFHRVATSFTKNT